MNRSLFLAILVITSLLAACTTWYPDSGVQVDFATMISQDSAYDSALKQWGREVSAYKDFETVATAQVVRLTPEFLQILEQRDIRLKGEVAKIFKDLKGVPFFVSINIPVPVPPKLELNSKVTDVSLEGPSGQLIHPTEIRDYKAWKEYLSMNFDHVSLWSMEYVVIFEKLPSDPWNFVITLPQARILFKF